MPAGIHGFLQKLNLYVYRVKFKKVVLPYPNHGDVMLLDLIRRFKRGRTNCRPEEKMSRALRFELRKRILSEINRRMKIIGVTIHHGNGVSKCCPPHPDHIAHTIKEVVHDVGEQYKVRMRKEFVFLSKTETVGVWVSILGKGYIFARVD